MVEGSVPGTLAAGPCQSRVWQGLAWPGSPGWSAGRDVLPRRRGAARSHRGNHWSQWSQPPGSVAPGRCAGASPRVLSQCLAISDKSHDNHPGGVCINSCSTCAFRHAWRWLACAEKGPRGGHSSRGKPMGDGDRVHIQEMSLPSRIGNQAGTSEIDNNGNRANPNGYTSDPCGAYRGRVLPKHYLMTPPLNHFPARTGHFISPVRYLVDSPEPTAARTDVRL
jgi:hypothetical protein